MIAPDGAPADALALRALVRELEPDGDASAEEAATRALREAIVRGVLLPGQRLHQEPLATELGVSRIPLRDAFRRLAAEGLIELDGRRGARVASLTLDEIAELYELRRMLELHCLPLAIRNLTDTGASELLATAARLEARPPNGNAALAHRGFYAELYRWSDRPRMVALILQIRSELGRYQGLKAVASSPAIHDQIVECIRTRDARAAVRHMREHIRRSRDGLVAAIRREPRARRRTLTRRRRADAVDPGRRGDGS